MKIKTFVLWVILGLSVLNSTTAQGAEEEWQFSLMYNKDEIHLIQTVRAFQLKNGQKNHRSISQIRLDGIAYIDTEHWSVWINEQMVDPEHPHPDIEVTQVSAEGISIRLKGQERMALVKLQINQAIDLDTVRYADQDKITAQADEDAG
jgi:hypothetical protein